MAELRTMFDTDRRLAIVPNVGPLILPTTKAQYGQTRRTRGRPSLFSHNDQQTTWQALAARRRHARLGRAHGRPAGRQQPARVFTAISASGNAVWLAGQNVQQYQVGSNGAIRLGADADGRVYGSTAVAEALDRIVARRAQRPSVRGRRGRGVAALDRRRATLRTALAAGVGPAFGTAPASGNYNANNDPKLRYVPPAHRPRPRSTRWRSSCRSWRA